jgi:hypothetical protein
VAQGPDLAVTFPSLGRSGLFIFPVPLCPAVPADWTGLQCSAASRMYEQELISLHLSHSLSHVHNDISFLSLSVDLMARKARQNRLLPAPSFPLGDACAKSPCGQGRACLGPSCLSLAAVAGPPAWLVSLPQRCRTLSANHGAGKLRMFLLLTSCMARRPLLSPPSPAFHPLDEQDILVRLPPLRSFGGASLVDRWPTVVPLLRHLATFVF